MPLLARMIAAPFVVDVRRGAPSEPAEILADQRISPSGQYDAIVGIGGGPVLDVTKFAAARNRSRSRSPTTATAYGR
jgi:glycerol-1-phosphate dehydrogenase [NAD(P)+]